MSGIRRIYVEKLPPYAVSAKELLGEIHNYLGIEEISEVRILIRYDIENVSEETYKRACNGVFAEPPVDVLYEEDFPISEREQTFSVEYLPGQYDQRADSAVQCIQFINEKEEPLIKSATTYVFKGNVSSEALDMLKNYCINPVDSRETSLEKPKTLVTIFDEPEDVMILEGFVDLDEEALKALYDSLGLAMTYKDFLHIQGYFYGEEKRNPTITEIKVLDTYWSDHCRHTTFSTELSDVSFMDGDYKEEIEGTYKEYLSEREKLFFGRKDKYVCLMDLALFAMRKLKAEGKLLDQEETDEINACSIIVPVSIDGKEEEWLVNFKNETHNHPTEIEPFGGAATCLGGAIRDPLSGRTYVYQAMRVTGASDPTVSLQETLKGKLPQKKLVKGAAKGYSSYGNQIGLATGLVKEIYHPNYVAKRMEIGAVLGAAKREAVVRKSSDPGDIIILLGGRTGRDGCGGATGSSKVHTEESIETCGAEVQKGNPPTERKLQRLFRRKEVSRLIKKCNDFGAGGVSVAIGELADGLIINLDKVQKKYEGLDGTEIAISESQERMAVVVAKEDVQAFLQFSKEENLEATEVAEVTKEKRLVLFHRGKEIVNISRAFLDTNGAHQSASVLVEMPSKADSILKKKEVGEVKEAWLNLLADLNVCSQKGLVEMFDGSIGAASVFMPYGGKYQLTETQTMVAKLPVQSGECDTVTMMSYGFDPYLSSWSPYHGAIYAVVDSVAKIVASGGDYSKIRFTFQEYFRRMSEDSRRWSQPFAALLGAYKAQIAFGLPSIGGKDSMSGSFQDIDVPPTLVSFAVDVATQSDIITPELKTAGNYLIRVPIKLDENDLPDFKYLKSQYSAVKRDIEKGAIVSAYALGRYGIVEAISKMAFGNQLGVQLSNYLLKEELFAPSFGELIAEVPEDKLFELETRYGVVGRVEGNPKFSYKEMTLTMEEALQAWHKPLESIFPTKTKEKEERKTNLEINELYKAPSVYVCKSKIAKPTVFIPVFPGTNCEYDSCKAFEEAGAAVITKVFQNQNATDIDESMNAFAKEIDKAQIIMFPGGFSAGDEPDGSAKFFATAFQNARLKEATLRLIEDRDGLILGICNGFQTLIKLGLLPDGTISGQRADSPTLTYNTIGRHISKMVYTKVVSNLSPWLQNVELGGVYTNPASHGEGRFIANESVLKDLFTKGQVATRYVDLNGNIAPDGIDNEWNPNGSYMAIEGITSADGRIMGKMAHVERQGKGVAINIYGEQDMQIFKSGVSYFS